MSRSRRCVRRERSTARLLAHGRRDVQERDRVPRVQRSVAVCLSVPRGKQRLLSKSFLIRVAVQGRWRPSQFTPHSWTERNFTTANTWSRVLNQNLFSALNRRATARRYANILTTNIYCRYSKLISAVTPLACDCGEDRAANEECFASITQSVMSVIQACNNVPTEFNVRLGNVTIDVCHALLWYTIINLFLAIV